MNIFLRELRANLKSLIIWGVIVILFTVVGFSKFSAYYHNPEMSAILDGFPTAMVEAAAGLPLTKLRIVQPAMVLVFGRGADVAVERTVGL